MASLDVAAEARRLREQADRLIADHIDPIVSQLGSPNYTGSYGLDLMAWGDIDVSVPCDLEAVRESFLKLGSVFAGLPFVRGMRFIDFVRYPGEGLPSGLYWGIEMFPPPGGERWKLDLFAQSPQTVLENRRLMEHFEKMMDDDARETILEAKHAMMRDGRTPSLSGVTVYEAVLEKRLSDVAEIQAYVESRGTRQRRKP